MIQMTLDTLIKQKASASSTANNNTSSDPAIDDEQRQILHALLLPELAKKKGKSKQSPALVLRDSSEMWKSSASRPQELHDPPATARF